MNEFYVGHQFLFIINYPLIHDNKKVNVKKISM